MQKEGDRLLKTLEILALRRDKAENYPEGFQTLCMNCQFVKRAERNEYPNSPTLGK